jgi:site-specific recombinase XerD
MSTRTSFYAEPLACILVKNDCPPEIRDAGTLFLTNLFEPFTSNWLIPLVREYIDAADLGKRGSFYLLRHPCATLML